jgi:hypothetical protein
MIERFQVNKGSNSMRMIRIFKQESLVWGSLFGVLLLIGSLKLQSSVVIQRTCLQSSIDCSSNLPGVQETESLSGQRKPSSLNENGPSKKSNHQQTRAKDEEKSASDALVGFLRGGVHD